MTQTVSLSRRPLEIIIPLIILVGLYITSIHNYLLFHSLAEVFAIVIACCIFIIAWHTRKLYDNSYFLVVGIASLFIAGITLLHALSYKGMGVFPYEGANHPTQLWIAMRGLESATFLVAPFLIGKKLRAGIVFTLYAILFTGIVWAIFVWHIFPVCYIDTGAGHLTQFKIVAEYLLCGVLLLALLATLHRRTAFDRTILWYLVATIIVKIAAGLMFTAYVSVFDFANLTGHLLNIVSYYLLYRAMVAIALSQPFALLFRELKQSEEALREAHAMQERTTEFLVHDLRSPLTSILVGISALRESDKEKLSDFDHQLLDGAYASTSWLATLISALLDTSRLENGKMPLRQERMMASELIKTAIQQVEVWARLARIEICYSITPQTLALRADQALSLRVLVNLLSNALKYSREGTSINLAVSEADDSIGQSHMAVINVTDVGPGMAPEWTERVFDRFVTNEARAAGVAGSGLGLSFCKLAIEAQGGSVSLTSTVGVGTTVTFTLPLAEAPTP